MDSLSFTLAAGSDQSALLAVRALLTLQGVKKMGPHFSVFVPMQV